MMTVAPGNLGLGPSCGLHGEAESIGGHASFVLMSRSCGVLLFPNCCICFPSRRDRVKFFLAGENLELCEGRDDCSLEQSCSSLNHK